MFYVHIMLPMYYVLCSYYALKYDALCSYYAQLCIMFYVRIMLNYVVVNNLCPLTQSTCLTIKQYIGGEFVHGILARGAKNALTVSRPSLCVISTSKSPNEEYNQKNFRYYAMLKALYYA